MTTHTTEKSRRRSSQNSETTTATAILHTRLKGKNKRVTTRSAVTTPISKLTERVARSGLTYRKGTLKASAAR